MEETKTTVGPAVAATFLLIGNAVGNGAWVNGACASDTTKPTSTHTSLDTFQEEVSDDASQNTSSYPS